jgi:hypothetical protein
MGCSGAGSSGRGTQRCVHCNVVRVVSVSCGDGLDRGCGSGTVRFLSNRDRQI